MSLTFSFLIVMCIPVTLLFEMQKILCHIAHKYYHHSFIHVEVSQYLSFLHVGE
jgi:hypothetical protein